MYEPYDSVLFYLLLAETFFGVFAAFFPTDGVFAILIVVWLVVLLFSKSLTTGLLKIECENRLGIGRESLLGSYFLVFSAS
jgi:hypothetical protein